MSDQQKNGDKGGFGPKKPKATFGDVMLGIPSGDRGERGGRSERRSDGPKKEHAEAAPAEGGQEAPKAEAKPPQRREKGGGGGKKDDRRGSQGPMVVVKRASGAVETRSLEEPSSTTAPAEETQAQADASAREPAPVPTSTRPAPAPVKSALYEEVPEDQSFADMFEAAEKADGDKGRKQFRVGEKVSGKIFQLGADTAFISLGGKSEAMIELRELKDDEGILRFGVGDTVDAHVIETGAKGIILSRTLAKGSASMAMLAEARASGMPVEGLVLSVNKGGFEVAVGDTRAFCPISQMDLRFVEKPETFVGEKLRFRVTEVRERNVVLSRRSLLEEEQKALATETRKGLAEGKTVRGKVTGVRDFGAFVDLGGVEGMIPVSELSHTRVGHPSEVLKVGDDVEVDVIRLEAANPNSPDKAKQKERITLSLRARQEDPWQSALEEIKEGARLKGKVVRLQPFGAFVELRPGVDGLIHVSALSHRRIAHPKDVVKVGQEVDVQVEKVDPAEKRVSLRLVVEGEEAPTPSEARPAGEAREPRENHPRPKAGQIVTGKVDRIEQYGVFLAFPGGKGLIPSSETGTDRGTDLKRVFTLGQEVKAAVLEVDGSGKIRLSIPAAQRAEERAEVEAWKSSQPKGTGGKGFGTFADLLKGLK